MQVTVPGDTSLSKIVPVTALVVPTEYPVPAARVSTTVSLPSLTASVLGSRVMMATLDPAAKVTLPVELPKVEAPRCT